MSAFQNLLTRLGYVKLGRFGLALTPEGRILSMRPAALDDGLGGRIVGWEDGDLAAMELGKWEPARPAPPQAMTPRVAVPRSTAAMPPPVPTRPRSPTLSPMPAMPAMPAINVAVVVAPPTEPEEDWEWTIAIARARAAAEEAEQAAAALRAAPPAVRPVVALVPEVREIKPIALPLPAPRVETPRPTLRVVPTAPGAKTASRTVIPVPSLPTLGDRRLEPVVRASAQAAPLRRFPKGTLDHDTVTRVEAIEASEDDTQTGITMPPAVALPSIRQRMSSR